MENKKCCTKCRLSITKKSKLRDLPNYPIIICENPSCPCHQSSTTEKKWEEKFFDIIDADGMVENEKGNLESPSDIIKRNFISKKEAREMIENYDGKNMLWCECKEELLNRINL